MKWPSLAVIVCVVALSGCATLNYDDRLILKQHNVSPALFDKMAHGEPLAVPDIIELSKKGLPDPFIIYYLSTTETSYPLTVDDVTQLKKAGVNPGVINYLLSTPSIYGPPRYPFYPPPYPYGPYYYGYPTVVVPGPYHPWHHW